MLRSFDAGFARAYWCVMSAELDGLAGEHDVGLDSLAWALDHIEDGSRYMLPEMHRLRARLLAGKGREYQDAALAAITDALVTAREHGSLLFELRAALEQVRIEKQLDLSPRGIDTLRQVSARFDQGHDCLDLVEARSILANA
jgi:predicted ATPase